MTIVKPACLRKVNWSQLVLANNDLLFLHNRFSINGAGRRDYVNTTRLEIMSNLRIGIVVFDDCAITKVNFNRLTLCSL